MSDERCPDCGFAYGWGGGYCAHCRRGRPDRGRWEAFAALKRFPKGIGDSRVWLYFAGACCRRAARLADGPVGRLIGSLEALARDRIALDDFRLHAGPVLEGRRYDPEGPQPYPADPQALACRAVARFARLLGEGGWSESDVLALADEVRDAVAGESCPERDVRSMLAVRRAEEAEQCDLFRDLVAYPYAPVRWQPHWGSVAAVSLAREVHETADFACLPIMADALEDAGCDDDELLGHCRGPGPHVPGCWAVGRVLGRQ